MVADDDYEEDARDYYSRACSAGDCGYCFSGTQCLCACHNSARQRDKRRLRDEHYDG